MGKVKPGNGPPCTRIPKGGKTKSERKKTAMDTCRGMVSVVKKQEGGVQAERLGIQIHTQKLYPKKVEEMRNHREKSGSGGLGRQ